MRIVFAALLLLVSALPAHAALEHDKVYEAVMKNKVIRCGYADWAPFIVTDPNTKQISGAMKDIMDEIGKRLGVKIEWTASVGWGEITTAANAGKIDMFCNTVWTDKAQLQNMTLSRPVYYTPTFAFAREGDTRFDNNYAAINAPTTTIVGIDGDTSYITMTDNFPQAKMLALPGISDPSEPLVSLVAKKADITLSDETNITEYSKVNPGKIRKVAGPPLFIMNEVFVTRAGEQQFMNVINTILYSLINEGVLEKIFAKYGVTHSFVPQPEVKLPARVQ